MSESTHEKRRFCLRRAHDFGPLFVTLFLGLVFLPFLLLSPPRVFSFTAHGANLLPTFYYVHRMLAARVSSCTAVHTFRHLHRFVRAGDITHCNYDDME